ncbi:hypothetical protein JCM8097_006687 [Rhodosporidiobolus ruineniae]
MSISLALPPSGVPSSQRPVSSVQSHPLVLAAMLDAHLRRSDGQDRVFGTLLGSRNPDTGAVELKNAFAVPYEVRGRGQVTIDMDHHRALLDLHLKVQPRETVVGWFATAPTLNSFSALIHNFYSSEAAPFPAVHLTLDPATLAVAAYTASPIGTGASSSSSSAGAQLAFTPVDVAVKVAEQDRPGLDLLTANLSSFSASVSASVSAAAGAPSVDAPVALQTPLAQLHALLAHVQAMLDQVLSYVRDVNAGEREGDAKVGRALLETVGSVPSSSKKAPAPAAQVQAQQGEEGQATDKVDGFEEEFNQHLADVLMVSYLSNVIKSQSEIAGRLGLLL